MSNVLVLNSSYMPIQVTTLKRTLKLLFKEKAEVVSVEEGKYASYDFSSWEEMSLLSKDIWDKNKSYSYFNHNNSIFGIPKVIRLVDYNKIPVKLRINRRNIILRDDHKCQYCGKKKSLSELNIDHIIPKSKGGKNTWENLTCACISCNSKKRDRTPKEANMKLLNHPVKPTIYLMFKKYLNGLKIEDAKEWVHFFPQDFISEAYWSVSLID